jgi:hypothetical protein
MRSLNAVTWFDQDAAPPVVVDKMGSLGWKPGYNPIEGDHTGSLNLRLPSLVSPKPAQGRRVL